MIAKKFLRTASTKNRQGHQLTALDYDSGPVVHNDEVAATVATAKTFEEAVKKMHELAKQDSPENLT